MRRSQLNLIETRASVKKVFFLFLFLIGICPKLNFSWECEQKIESNYMKILILGFASFSLGKLPSRILIKDSLGLWCFNEIKDFKVILKFLVIISISSLIHKDISREGVPEFQEIFFWGSKYPKKISFTAYIIKNWKEEALMYFSVDLRSQEKKLLQYKNQNKHENPI